MPTARWILLATLLSLAACDAGFDVTPAPPGGSEDIGDPGGGSDPGGGPTGNDPGAIVRGPQLAQAQPESIVVAWRSDIAVVGAVVLGDGTRVTDSEPTEEHVFTVTGLAPDTPYEYSLEQEGVVVSGGHTLRTAPAAGTGTVRFVVIGDSGSGSERQREVAEQMALSAPDLVLITGDVVYEDGAEDEIDPGYFEPYAALVDRVPFYPALGNHDARTDGGQPLLDALYLPRNSTTGTEHFYSFDRGPVHFVALDSNRDLDPGSDQHDWLAADLAANTSAWTVLYLHHPPYSSSSHGSDLDVRAALVPLCDQHGVDIVFAGHDHVYERTHALVDDEKDPDGTVYVVTGGGGRSLYKAGTSSFTAASVAEYHHVEVVIEGATLSLRAIDHEGAELDSASITKGP